MVADGIRVTCAACALTECVSMACRGVTRVAKTSGCALSGFVLVKKVPGTLHFLAKSPGHSFDHQTMNLSHVVGYMYFGTKPSPRWRKVGSPIAATPMAHDQIHDNIASFQQIMPRDQML